MKRGISSGAALGLGLASVLVSSCFIPVANSGYEVARVPIADGVHVLDGGTTPFSVIIVGYDQHDSYAYLGGTGTGVINPIPQ